MSSNNIVDSISEPYIDGLLVLSDPSYPSLELFCANTILSPPSDHELSTYSCNNHLLEAAFDYSLVPCLDHSSPKPSINHRKRCASIDLADVFNQSDGGWRINNEISANLQDQVQMINGDILKDYLLIDDDYAPNTAVISANYDCSDLEDVLDFLLKESDTVSTQSVMPRLENSLSLSDSTNQAEPDGDPSSGFHNIEKEKEDGGENRARWQGKQAGEIRTSWQQIQGGGEVRASWQQKQGAGEIRASWQPPTSEQGRCREGGPSPQLQDIGGPRGSSSAVWAGPTLMDIESALATRGSPTHHNSSTAISSDSSTASSTVLGETDPQEKITSFFDVRKLLTDELPMCKKQLEKHNLGVSWRLKLLKRNHLEPKHSIKVRREEGAAGDGYRWRKYGQKNIKNVPFPRSYYKCSSGKCNAKKQVERCHEDDELLLVTYEGIHLHHRPNPIRPIGMLVEH